MPSERVLLLFEPGRTGAAAIDVGRKLVQEDHADLTVVSLAPRAQSGARCGNSALDYNGAVLEAVVRELDSVRERLGADARFELLVEGEDPPLQEYAAASGFDLILLPARWRPLRAVKHPAAAALRRLTGAEVRIVGAGGVGAA